MITAVHSYRVVVYHGNFDDESQHALIGLKASGPFKASILAKAVTGAKGVLTVYRQDRHIPERSRAIP